MNETDRTALEQAIGHCFSELRHLERALTRGEKRFDPDAAGDIDDRR